MKTIPLTKGMVTTVSDEDYEFLIQWSWYAHKNRDVYYAARRYKKDGKHKIIYMHRVIANPPDGMLTDHKDRNRLNNQRPNLRICTNQENQRNTSSNKGSSSKYLGVSIKKNGKWRMKIKVSNELTINGTFLDEDEAAKAYDGYAKQYFGEFASLNFPEISE